MVTTTTSPRRASRSPRYSNPGPAPFRKAPPWIHTITGRRASSVAGVHTLRVRQSSSWPISSPPMPPPAGAGGCGAHLPHSSAGRTSLQGVAGWGGRNCNGPTGGAANGIPLKTARPSSTTPATRPLAVSTIGVLMGHTLLADCWYARVARDHVVQPEVFEVPHRLLDPAGARRRLRAGPLPGEGARAR